MTVKHVIIGQEPEIKNKIYKWKLEMSVDAIKVVCNDEAVLIAYPDGDCYLYESVIKELGLNSDVK